MLSIVYEVAELLGLFVAIQATAGLEPDAAALLATLSTVAEVKSSS